MNNKRTKKVVYTILIIFVILGIILVIVTRGSSASDPKKPTTPGNPSTTPGTNPDNPDGNKEEGSTPITPKILKDASEFFTIQNIITTYLNYIQEGDTTAVYNLLSRTYTSTHNLNTSNCLVENIPYESYTYKATKINYYELNDDITVYFVIGEAKEDLFESSYNSKTIYHLVTIDLSNFTSSITPLKDVTEYNNALTKTKTSDLTSNITKNSYNTFKFQNVSTDTLVSTYYYYYLDKLLHDPKSAYELLNKEYREKRFKTYELFTTYLNENISSLGEATIASYRYKEGTTNTYYITNSKGDTLIFRDRGIMQLEVYLDEVTIKL